VSRGAAGRRRIRRSAEILAAVLALWGPQAPAQKNGLAFWEPDAARVDALLRANPKKDVERYDIVRRSMVNLGCTGPLLREQPAGKQAKNLICTLEGRTPERILVMARVDDRGRDRPTWSDAVMLPMLYHALQAQTRQHTFVLAAVDGRDGEKAWIAELRKPGQPPPVVSVVLDSLGSGPPFVHTEPLQSSDSSSQAAQTQSVVWAQSMKTRELMGIPVSAQWPQGLSGLDFQHYLDWQQWLFGDALFHAVRQTPGVLLFSTRFSDHADAIDTAAFHQDFDFVAWLLCGIDVQLGTPRPAVTGSAQPPAAQP
jgi:hypothetical protein